MAAHKPVILIVLDGWGIREMEHGNAVKQANTPNYDHWLKGYERSILGASGEAVGLVADQMGNSEVGHLNLGAGRIVYQDITRIQMAINNGELGEFPALKKAFARVKENGGKLHLIGLLSDGGVHSHEDHLYALLDIMRKNDLNPVIHMITDGRDTSPTAGIKYARKLEKTIEEHQRGRIGTVSGRYYAMDRDKRWERTQKAYAAMVYGEGEKASSAHEAIQRSYDQDVTDEFIMPVVLESEDDLYVQAGDALLFFNFRADRMRQIARAFAMKDFDEFETTLSPDDLYIVTFTEYEEEFPVEVLFSIELLKNTLAEMLSKAGLKQYHSAETEKYAHVTYFFNGRNEEPFAGEDRRIIPSPKVATYDLKPEMSAYELTEATLERIQTHDDDFILINYANPDMVGHSGSLEAAIKACTAVDECAGRLTEAILKKGGVALITADHGNAERMIDELTGEAHTYHTTSAVSFFVITDSYFMLRPRGILADVAPTVLDLLGIEKPQEMTGRTLIEAERLEG